MSLSNFVPLGETIGAMIERSRQLGIPLDPARGAKPVSCISFRDYMAAALYDKDRGYYRSGAIRVGKDGDFYTSSAIGDVMGEIIARYALEWSRGRSGAGVLMEWGAGTGRLSAAIHAAGERLDGSWRERLRPILVDDHPAHAAEIARSFAERGLETEPLVLCSERATAGTGVEGNEEVLLLANELLDALPFHRVMMRHGELVELGVAGDARSGWHEAGMALSDERLEAALRRDGIRLAEGQTTEICLEAEEWLQRIGERFPNSTVMLIDYGHEAQEYAAPHRMNGTALAYWRHTASGSLLARPGEQDITAHVNFTALRHAAREAGFEQIYYATQKNFLVDHGVLGLLQEHDHTDPFGPAARRNRAVRQLLLSDGMSEAFKVMILEHGDVTKGPA